ncbi:cyclase family protein [Compostimonas suwonensis]|uniref:Kynurenine formamidase n=1 Tax=Compostimonas suwonensis TaxID=1048394 RepID=A0A2M9BU80_9MICO|nr:cyclase family protein [Compostimonas suwonensis]PJJ61504.1 kynurenine formamidase [Compostimonas suwonensis]
MSGNWGRWGSSDEIGALNLVGPDEVRRAASLVREGTVVALAQPSGAEGAVPPHRGRGMRFMDRDAGDYALGARVVGGFKFAEDTVMLSTHSGTHVDALSHVWSGDELFNGHPASTLRSTTGAARLGAETLRSIMTRGVLIDLVAARGEPLPASTRIGAEELARGYASAGLVPEAGDALVVRTGWWESHRESHADYFDNEPGLDESAAEWIAAADIAIVGVDNYAIEVQPSSEGTRFPVHLALIHEHGVPFIENLELDGLVGRGVAEFCFVVAPVGFAGSTAGQVTPLAIL